jgi:sec-independent protein translocase protein TatA
MFGLGAPELILIFLVILLLFGAKRLPELARGLGKSISEFKKASSNAEDEIRQAINTEAPPTKPTPTSVPVKQAESLSPTPPERL